MKIAEVAHLVERDLAKVEVAGSSPVFRSEKIPFCFIRVEFFICDGVIANCLPGWWNW